MKDLKKLIESHYGPEWMSIGCLSFFVELLCVEIDSVPNREEKDDDEGSIDDPAAIDTSFPVCCEIEESPEFIV